MMQVLLCTLLAVSRASSRFASQLDVEAAMLVGDERLNFLSATFGDHMVLQRAPQQAVVFGHSTPGAAVTTTFNGHTMTAKADVNGTWRQKLPAMEASFTAYTLTFKSSAGEMAALHDVLFGDVYLCGGQSNMQFSMPAIANASEEIALADKYPHIRLFTVGQKTSSAQPLRDLQTIEQNWTVASHTSIAQGGRFGEFSAVCWIFGRQIFDKLGKTVPLGLVSNNWGGTPVEHWSTPGAFASCGRVDNDGRLYNAMINPYTVGPMALKGFTWYQGEANTRGVLQANQYACLFPAMITGWREAFQNPTAYFGYVQLSTWCGNPDWIARMRAAQQFALKLPNVGYSTNADHGAGCNIHPTPKQYCGERLGDSALAIVYGQALQWKSPTFKSATASVSHHRNTPTTVMASVTVALNDVGAGGVTADVYPFNYIRGLDCDKLNEKTAGTCAWASLLVNGKWVNASVTAKGSSLVLSSEVTLEPGMSLASATPTDSAYAWGAIPMMNAYDKDTNLPVLPWNTTSHTSMCETNEYCCPDAKHCLAPTKTSCAADASVCKDPQVCCPLTKLCVDVHAPCTSPCGAGSYCCPDAKHCLTPVKPGTLCSANSCGAGEVCCPVTSECVRVGPACTPP